MMTEKESVSVSDREERKTSNAHTQTPTTLKMSTIVASYIYPILECFWHDCHQEPFVTHSLAHLLYRALSKSHSATNRLALSFTQSRTLRAFSLTHSHTHSQTQAFTHPLTHSLTHHSLH